VLTMKGASMTTSPSRDFDFHFGSWRQHHRRLKERTLDPPMIGRFDGDVGTFYADDTFNGIPIKVRFLWLDIRPRFTPMGAGLLGRWRQDLGNELDHNLH
jgi:hypothetical protein